VVSPYPAEHYAQARLGGIYVWEREAQFGIVQVLSENNRPWGTLEMERVVALMAFLQSVVPGLAERQRQGAEHAFC
jgi:hypothetical protein